MPQAAAAWAPANRHAKGRHHTAAILWGSPTTRCLLLCQGLQKAARGREGSHLQEAILGKGDKCDGDGGDEAAGDGDEGADEHKQRQQAQARDRQGPHACRRQRRVHQRYARLQTIPVNKRCSSPAQTRLFNFLYSSFTNRLVWPALRVHDNPRDGGPMSSPIQLVEREMLRFTDPRIPPLSATLNTEREPALVRLACCRALQIVLASLNSAGPCSVQGGDTPMESLAACMEFFQETAQTNPWSQPSSQNQTAFAPRTAA